MSDGIGADRCPRTLLLRRLELLLFRGGAEAAHAVRGWTTQHVQASSKVLVKLDFPIAFNTVSRQQISPVPAYNSHLCPAGSIGAMERLRTCSSEAQSCSLRVRPAGRLSRLSSICRCSAAACHSASAKLLGPCHLLPDGVTVANPEQKFLETTIAWSQRTLARKPLKRGVQTTTNYLPTRV